MSAHANPVRTILPLLVCAAFLFAMPRVASAQRTCTSDGGACTYNGVTFTMADLRKFAPEVQFHVAERFFPASIDWILERATQVDAAGNARTGGGSPQQRMADYPDDRLIIDSAAFGGMPPVNGFSPAPMYVAVQVPDHRRWVELHYVMLFPFNGPQTYRRFLSGGDFNFFGRTIAEHQGDLEMITVRVARDFSEVLSVRFENHGNSKHFFPSQVTFHEDATGTHPFVSSALHSHSTWNPTAYGKEDWESTYQNAFGGVIDLFGSDLPGRTESGGFDDQLGGTNLGADVRWRPWDASTGASLTLMGLDADGQPVNDQAWARFAGRLGAEQVNAVTDVYEIGEGPGNPVSLTGAQRDHAMFMLTFPVNLSLFLDQEHAGPEGPGVRDWIRPPASTTVYLRSRVGNSLDGDAFNLFLTANPVFGATVESRSAMCTTSQLWEVSTWPASADGKAGTTGLALLNRRTRGLLEYRGRRTQVNATLPLATSHLSGVTLWSIGGPEPFYVDQQQPANVPPGYAFSAFRPLSDIDESNLNVFTANDRTASPGTTVGVWDWGVCGYPFPPFPVGLAAGCPNNIWRFEEANCPLIPVPTSSAFFSPQGNNGWLVGDPSQVNVAGSASASAIRIQFDNGPIDTYFSSGINLHIFGQGEHSVSFGAWDFDEDLQEPMHQASIKIDSITPQIFASRFPSPNSFGWNKSPVVFLFSCSDERSGVASCAPQQTLSFNGKGQAVRGFAHDVAGNLGFVDVFDINIDRTAPTVTAVRSPLPNALGWNNTPVTVTTHASDALSGILFQNTPTFVFSNEGAFFSFFASAVDKADNTGIAGGPVMVDRTPPILNAFVIPSPNAAGWNKTPVTVHGSAFDTLSGIDFASQPQSQTVSVDTAGFSVITKANDRADNESSVTTVVRIDRIPPIVTASVAPSANALGWINAPATVNVNATDALSGVAFTSEPQIVSVDSDGFSVVGTARDRADNESSVTTVVRIDQTPPSITAVLAPSPNAEGWNNTPATVSVVATDALSGIAFASDPQTVNGDTAGLAIVGKARDRADNESSVTTTVRLDRTPPSIAAVVAPSPNAQGWNNTPVTVSVAASDALSGIASTSAPVSVNGDVAGFIFLGNATDNAGNVSTVSTTVNIDQAAPELYLLFDPENDDVALFPRDSASGVPPSALTPASAVERCNGSDWGGGGHDDDAEDEDESNPCHGLKKGERRTYSVPDTAGNLIEVVIDVLVHHDHVRARFVTIGYNGGAAAPVRRNIASFKSHSGPSKPLDVDQKIRLWFDEFTDHVNAKFEEKKGTTTIKSVRSGQSTNTVRSGRVLLRLATATGILNIED